MNDQAIFDFYPAYTQNSQPKGLLSIPHAGEWIPDEFKEYLTTHTADLNSDVDYKTNELVDIEALRNAGVSVIVSNVHRTCVDLNRSPELCVFAWQKNSHAKELVIKQPDEKTKDFLRQKYYQPYYDVLKSQIQKLNQIYGENTPIIDLHSMPSHPTAYHLSVTPDQPHLRPTFCLSNLKGESSSLEFIENFQSQLEAEFPGTGLNYPYYGGYLTQFMNTFPGQNFQIEVRRNLYMDEGKRELVARSEKVKEVLTRALVGLFTKA